MRKWANEYLNNGHKLKIKKEKKARHSKTLFFHLITIKNRTLINNHKQLNLESIGDLSFTKTNKMTGILEKK